MPSLPQTQGGQAPYWQGHKKIKDKTKKLAVLQVYRKILIGGGKSAAFVLFGKWISFSQQICLAQLHGTNDMFLIININ